MLAAQLEAPWQGLCLLPWGKQAIRAGVRMSDTKLALGEWRKPPSFPYANHQLVIQDSSGSNTNKHASITVLVWDLLQKVRQALASALCLCSYVHALLLLCRAALR